MSLNEHAPVVRVFGEASGDKEMTGRHPSPDTTVAQLLFANGVYGLWNLGFTAPRVVDRDVVWMHCRVAAFAEPGRTLYQEFGRWEIAPPDGIEKAAVADMEAWAKGRRRAGSSPVVGRHAVNGVNAWRRAKRRLSQH